MIKNMANLTRRHNSLSVNVLKIHVFYKNAKKLGKNLVASLHYTTFATNLM